jgi:malonyl CoA-acyl carrier protein transacylase
MSLAFVFPGQGSQSLGMVSALAGSSPVIESVFAQASEVLGYDLWERCQEGPEEALNQTECTQPAMLAVNSPRLCPAIKAGTQPRRVHRAGGGGVPRFQGCGRSGAVQGAGDAGRGAGG